LPNLTLRVSSLVTPARCSLKESMYSSGRDAQCLLKRRCRGLIRCASASAAAVPCGSEGEAGWACCKVQNCDRCGNDLTNPASQKSLVSCGSGYKSPQGLGFCLSLSIITTENGAGVICSHIVGGNKRFAEPHEKQAEQPACQPNFSVKDVDSSANTASKQQQAVAALDSFCRVLHTGRCENHALVHQRVVTQRGVLLIGEFLALCFPKITSFTFSSNMQFYFQMRIHNNLAHH